MRRLLAALCLPLLSCGAGQVTIKVDPTCSTEVRAAFERATWRWRDFAHVDVRVDDDGDWLVLPVESPGGWNGEVDAERRIIRISPDTTEPPAAVALHETGHALGLRDLAPGLDGVMDPTRPTTTWTIHDHNECERAGLDCEYP